VPGLASEFMRISRKLYDQFMKRGLGLVVLLIGVAILVSAAATAMLYVMVAPGPRVVDNSTLVLRPGGELVEVVPDDVLQFVGP
jgi:hypothetical protein